MSILSEDQTKKFVIANNALIPEDLLFENNEKDLFLPFYKYDNGIIEFLLSRIHYEINSWINHCSLRINQNKSNRNITSGMKAEMKIFEKIILQWSKFFTSNSINFSIDAEYKELVNFINTLKYDPSEHATLLPEGYIIIEPILDEPIFTLVKKNDLASIQQLLFGCNLTKPDIIISDLLDGNLQVLNESDVLMYDREIKDSLTYKDFTIWWNENKAKYKWYDSKTQMNEIELKLSKYYKIKYGKDEKNPVLIPQVYLHYDPKNDKMRKLSKYNSTLKFQRMDFLILYNGKRVIIEVDGKTHTPEESLKEYSRQCEYDRTMRFLGYDVFRLGGYELTHDFENTVSSFFINLFIYFNK